MNIQATNLDVNSIVFTSKDTEVLLKGSVIRGQLSYETDLLITQTQLNMILNTLGKQNDSFAIDDCLKSEHIGPDGMLFYADFGYLSNTSIEIESLMDMNEIVQIRA
ncbi:MAG: hypothetical protein ACI837_000720 [Crocinitomicaceae bacterium]|jgi:hypothetical protein